MRWLLQQMLRPLQYLVLRFIPYEPWDRIDYRVGFGRFAVASRHDFRWYFEGESRVQVDSVSALCDWLMECGYIRDQELFHEPDYWQHPRTFEQIRQGDCEDHALWAWRKLTELQISAEFFVGRWRKDEQDELGGHAWVVCTIDGKRMLMETTAADHGRMLRPFDSACNDYEPHFSVDASFKTAVYGGYMLWLKEQRRHYSAPSLPARSLAEATRLSAR